MVGTFVQEIPEHLLLSYALSKSIEDYFKTENDISINYLLPNMPDQIQYWAENTWRNYEIGLYQIHEWGTCYKMILTNLHLVSLSYLNSML